MRITNTWFVLPLIYAAHQLPMAIWIMKGLIESIPKELDEAAIIDGASTLRILRSVILPLSRTRAGRGGNPDLRRVVERVRRGLGDGRLTRS